MTGTETERSRVEKRSIAVSRSQMLVLLVLAFCLGLYVDRGIGLFAGRWEDTGDELPAPGEGEYRYIRYAPRFAGKERTPAEKVLRPFRYKVKAFVKKNLEAGEAAAISVYFRDLRDGHRFGIREQERFSADANLKLPLMLAYLKWAETSPPVLNRRFSYQAGTAEPESGRMVKVRTLIRKMIADNDDQAYAVLAANLPPARLQRIFKDIYINYDPTKRDEPMPFSAYASFYRVLYDASYLSRDMSEKALRFLSQAAYRDGIISGVPQDIDVVAKYGERALDEQANGQPAFMKQFHEVGIVYHPRHPYVMGVLVRGNDPGRLKKIIRDISSLIFQEVERQSY